MKFNQTSYYSETKNQLTKLFIQNSCSYNLLLWPCLWQGKKHSSYATVVVVSGS